MLELEATTSDDPEFIDMASRLITAAALTNDFSRLIVGHIDHWFGQRWLGFCGKLLGVAGVRSRRLTGELTPPPFHPNRIISVRRYTLTEPGVLESRGEVGWLHGLRPSATNINRTLLKGFLYAWYSGDTITSDKSVVMVYLVHRKWN